MTARQVWEGMLTELSKVNAPSMLLQDFNYFFNRAIKLQNKISGYYITTQKVDRVRIQVTPLNGKLNRYTLDGKYIDSFESAA